MNDSTPAVLTNTNSRDGYPKGFRQRRGLNWGIVGLMYTSFYMCRYNFSIANKAISDEFGFSKEQIGYIITVNMLAYACGQIINGLLTDRVGGKRAMLIGAAGTIILNIMFGVASFWGMLGLFVMLRGLDGYMQAFGAPGMIKINVTWFSKEERGRFAGIFGFMINLGRFGIFSIGPALLAGVTFAGMWHVPPSEWTLKMCLVPGIIALLAVIFGYAIKNIATWLNDDERAPFDGIIGFGLNVIRHGYLWLGPPLLVGFLFFGMFQVPAMHWRWLFWVPAGIAAVVAITLALLVKATPEEAGYNIEKLHEKDPAASQPGAAGVELTIRDVFMRIVTNPVIWVVAFAYACTGAVRQSVDQWFPRYMQEVFHADLRGAQFQWLAFLIPFVASTGSLISGAISDKLFKGSRAPVAAAIYFIETAIIICAAQMTTVNGIVLFFVLIAFTANSTHSLLGTAAAMDIGGKKMAGFASGVIDSFQYFGGSLAGVVLGKLLDSQHGWGLYFYFMAPFGLIGAILILVARKLSIKRGMTL